MYLQENTLFDTWLELMSCTLYKVPAKFELAKSKDLEDKITRNVADGCRDRQTTDQL